MQSDTRIRYLLNSSEPPRALSERAADLPGRRDYLSGGLIERRSSAPEISDEGTTFNQVSLIVITSLLLFSSFWHHFEAHHVGLVSKCCCLW